MKRSSPQARAFRPVLEQLEARLVPTVTLQHVDLDHDGAADDFRIRGDSQNTRIQIIDNPADGRISVSVDANGDGDFDDTALGDQVVLLQGISKKSVAFDIALGAGNDQVDYQTVGGDFNASLRRVLVNLGQGDDRFQFDTTGKDLINSDLRLSIAAGAGNDSANLQFGAVTNSNLAIRQALGAGNDESEIAFNRNIDFGSAAQISVDLGTGDNEQDVQLRGVGFNDVATVALNIRGGDDAQHKDVMLVEVNDVGNGVKVSQLAIRAQLFAGDDTFIAGLDRQGFRVDQAFKVNDGSRCTIVAHGGAGNDAVRVGTVGRTDGNIFVDAGAVFDVQLFGDGGNDSVDVILNNNSRLELAGTLRARVRGGSGSDLLDLDLENTDTTTGHYDLALFGDAGNDAARLQIAKNLGRPTFDGKVLLNGGLGMDTLENQNIAESNTIGFENFIFE